MTDLKYQIFIHIVVLGMCMFLFISNGAWEDWIPLGLLLMIDALLLCIFKNTKRNVSN